MQIKRKCDECPEWYEVDEHLVQYDRWRFCSVPCFQKYVKRWAAERNVEKASR